jgi:hypothetical protein
LRHRNLITLKVSGSSPAHDVERIAPLEPTSEPAMISIGCSAKSRYRQLPSQTTVEHRHHHRHIGTTDQDDEVNTPMKASASGMANDVRLPAST